MLPWAREPARLFGRSERPVVPRAPEAAAAPGLPLEEARTPAPRREQLSLERPPQTKKATDDVQSPVASYCTARVVYFEKSETIGPWITNNGFCNAPLLRVEKVVCFGGCLET